MSDIGTDDLRLDDLADHTPESTRPTEDRRSGQSLLAGLCMAFGVIHLLPEYAPDLYQSAFETFEQVWIFTIKPFFEFGVWIDLWDWDAAGGFAWLYALALAGLGGAAYTRPDRSVVRGAILFFGGNVLTYWVLTLFWDMWGGVGEFLLGSVLYTAVNLGLLALFVTRIDA